MNSVLGRLGAVSSIALMVGALVAVPQSAHAAETLDQQQTSEAFGQTDNSVNSSQSIAQTFTAGMTGGLSRIDLVLNREADVAAPLFVELRNVVAGAPGNTILATEQIAASAVPVAGAPFAFVSVPFGPAAAVQSGSQYAVVVHATSDDNYSVRGVYEGNPYGAGTMFSSPASPPAAWTEAPNFDLFFKTYVTPPVTPPAPVLDPACSFRVAASNFNVIQGTNGNDVLRGTSGRDLIFGYGGNDVIEGRGGNDVLCGGLGADSISGGRGDDRISGGPGNDRLFGNRGDDIVWGNRGRDVIRGGFGDDTVNGGPARDDVRS